MSFIDIKEFSCKWLWRDSHPRLLSVPEIDISPAETNIVRRFQ